MQRSCRGHGAAQVDGKAVGEKAQHKMGTVGLAHVHVIVWEERVIVIVVIV
jgi:hypothetical protein